MAAVAGRRNAPSESHSPGGNEGQGPATQNPIVSSLAGRDHSEFLASELLFHPKINQILSICAGAIDMSGEY